MSKTLRNLSYDRLEAGLQLRYLMLIGMHHTDQEVQRRQTPMFAFRRSTAEVNPSRNLN